MTIDALEKMAREAKALAEAAKAGEWRRVDSVVFECEGVAPIAHCHGHNGNAALIAASRTIVPSLADAVLRLVAVAKAASEFYRVTTFCPDTHDCPSREQLNVALSALAKSEEK